MYKLDTLEISLVRGADGSCLKDPPSGSQQDWENSTHNVVSGIYNGLVDAVSDIIEKVANAL